MSETGFTCSTCGKRHDELPMCVGWPAPAPWYSIPEAERQARTELSSDQCIVDGKHFFVLGRLLLPVLDGPGPFCWLAWVSLSERSFSRMTELWFTPGRENESPCFGWLQSALPYEPSTVNLKTTVRMMPVGERPLIELQAAHHPLVVEQRDGIGMARVRQMAERAMHG